MQQISKQNGEVMICANHFYKNKQSSGCVPSGMGSRNSRPETISGRVGFEDPVSLGSALVDLAVPGRSAGLFEGLGGTEGLGKLLTE